MPFLYTDETAADWAAQRLDAFGARVLLEAVRRIAVPAMDFKLTINNQKGAE